MQQVEPAFSPQTDQRPGIQLLHEALARLAVSSTQPPSSTPTEVHMRRAALLRFLSPNLGPVQQAHVGEHCERVAACAAKLAAAMGHPPQDVHDMLIAGLLHDIGKIAVPEWLLVRTAPLTAIQWRVLNSHAAIGADVARKLGASLCIVDAVAGHHRRFDEQLLHSDDQMVAHAWMPAVLSVADALTAMLTNRSYQSARPLEAALAELRRESGRQFDPHVVDVAHRISRSSPRALAA